MALVFMISLAAGMVAYMVLDCVVPYNISVRRVGGLTFWQFGKLGGTLHRKASRS